MKCEWFSGLFIPSVKNLSKVIELIDAKQTANFGQKQIREYKSRTRIDKLQFIATEDDKFESEIQAK